MIHLEERIELAAKHYPAWAACTFMIEPRVILLCGERANWVWMTFEELRPRCDRHISAVGVKRPIHEFV